MASSGGGIFASASAAVLINNSIVARNGETALARGRDVYGTVQSQGYNLIGASNDSSGWIASDILGTASDPVDPRLGALQDNGGATFTQALLPDSPAIAAGDPALLGTYDQRGVLRQGAVDIGAFETAP